MRISSDQCFMAVCHTLAMRSTCVRRHVGCVLVDQNNHIIGTGYNGVPKGAPHCSDEPCAGADIASGQGLDRCESIHAEQNALLQCRDVQNIHTVYTSTFPCMHCFKMIANTSCQRIVYFEDYASSRVSVVELNKRLRKPIEIVKYSPTEEAFTNEFSSTLAVHGKTDMASLVSLFSSGSIK
jgi:dCMP deaminase